jgi:hypothetical protein
MGYIVTTIGKWARLHSLGQRLMIGLLGQFRRVEMGDLGNGVVFGIAKIVQSIKLDLITNNEDIYLVLGSDGDLFSVEICSGEFASRKIIKLIHIEIKPKQEQTYELKDIIQLSTAAEWNAFIKLLSIAIQASKIEICLPLDGSGEFLTDWNAAVYMVSTNNGKLSVFDCKGNTVNLYRFDGSSL